MNPLNDIIEVYHAGTDKVENPICTYGRKDLDFGQGFYVTDIYEQAVNFAKTKSASKKKPGKINSYLLHKGEFLKNAKSLIFESYNEEWLEFIVACRSGNPLWKNYDYIEGGIADDRVIDTVTLYMEDQITQPQALKKLIYLKPNNQICLLNQELLDKHLDFKECITI